MKSILPGLLEPESPVTFCVYGSTFWDFFPWVLATLFQFPLFRLSGVLVVSRLIGGTLNDFSGLVTSWALEGESFGRPTIEDSSPICFPDSQDLWKSHACLSGKGLRLKAQGVYLVTFFFEFLTGCLTDVPSCLEFKFKFLEFVGLGRVDGPTCSTSISIELEVVGVCQPFEPSPFRSSKPSLPNFLVFQVHFWNFH